MAVNFSVQFIINETTQTRVIRLTDTSSGFTFGKSLFSVYFPDGSSRVKTDYNSPDITVSGGYVDIVPVLSNNTFITGEYRIVCTAIDSSDVEQTPLQRTFDFNWAKPSNGLRNDSDVIIPEVKFTDTNSYDIVGSFTGIFTRRIDIAFPSTSEASGVSIYTTVSNTLNAINFLSYYEGIYNPTSTISALYTHTSNSWLTVQYDEIFTKQFDIRKTPTQLELIGLINNFRATVESYENVNDTQFQALNYKYERIMSLYTHIITRYDTLTQDGSEGQLRELLSILQPYILNYSYQSGAIQPFEIYSAAGNSFTITDTANIDSIQLGDTLTFVSSEDGLFFTVSNNSLTLNPTTGYSIPTDSKQTEWDAAYNDKINSVSVTGTTTKTITLTQQDGGTVTTTWTDYDTAPVTSVFGRTGDIVATNGDYTTSQVTEGTNLYYTQGRFDTAFGLKTTTNLTEGTNLYYTQGRFDTAFAAKSTTDLSEGTNLYYTDARVRAAISETITGIDYNSTTGVFSITTGYSIPTNTAQGEWTAAYNNRIATFTTTGNSGAATFTSNTLNIPNYTLSGLGGEPAITAGTTAQYWRGDKSFQTLDTTAVAEGTNLYYTQARFDTAFGLKSTTDLSEGTNLYYTDGRFDTRFATKTTDNLTEGTSNLYFTAARVRATDLTGLNITGSAIVAGDTIIQALGKIQNQINGLVGSVIYQGTWDASLNSPSLISATGTKGYYYKVSVAGSTNLDGITDWKVGDWVIYNGSAWEKVDNTDSVSSVNGYTGAVSLVTTDISEGVNLYYTDARFDTRFATKTTTNLTEGTNLYYTQGRFDTAFAAKSTTNLTEGTNLYYTDARARAALSNGAPITYNSATGVIGITQSTTTTDGYLSSTDWNTFNNKQDALTNPITGSLTSGYIPKATGSTTLGNSIIYENASGIGIGTTTDSGYKLDVNGTGRFSGALSTTGQLRLEPSTYGSIVVGSRSSEIDFQIYNTANLFRIYNGSTDALSIATGSGAATFSSSVTAGGTIYNNIAGHDSIGLYLTTYQPSGINWYDTDDYEQYSMGIIANSGNGYWGLWSSTSGTAINRATTTPKFVVKNNGNVGIGVVPSAWASPFTVIQTHYGSYFGGTTTGGTVLGNNNYYNGTNYIYSNTDGASQYQQYGGNHLFRVAITGTAGNTITWNPALTIDSSGSATFSSSVTAGGFINSQASSINSNGGMFLLSNNYTYFIGKSTGNGAILSNGDGTATVRALSPNGSNGYLEFETGNGTNRLTISSSGAATFSSPSSGLGDYQLVVTNGTKSIKFGANTTGAEIQSIGSVPLYINYSGNDTILNGSSGNVGIGTSPSTKFEVYDSNGVPIRFGDISSAISGQTAGYIGMSTSAFSGNNGDLVLYPRTSATSRILLMGGNVGIGTTSIYAKLHVSGTPDADYGNATVFDNRTATINYGGVISFSGYKSGTSAANVWGQIAGRNESGTGTENGYLSFITNNGSAYAERMRITSGGQVEAYYNFIAKGVGGSNVLASYHTGDSTQYGWFNAGNGTFVLTHSNVANRGYFTMSTGAYTATSDRNLKNNIVDSGNALDIVSQIKVRSYNWKYDNSYEPFGIIAQELYDIAPTYAYAPVNEGDTWGVSKAEMVPMLIKAIQELKAELDALKNI